MKKISHLQTATSIRLVITITLMFCLIGFDVLEANSGTFPKNAANDNTKTPTKSENKYGRKSSCPRCAPPGDQEIYIPLIDLPSARGGELVFNSRSPQPMKVTPRFYRLDGSTVMGDPVVIDSAEIRYVDIRKLIPAPNKDELDWGGLSLLYHGLPREMWAQYRFLRVNGGSDVDQFFTVASEDRSDTQQAAWWNPGRGTAILAFGNVTDLPTSAEIKLDSGETRSVTLAPRGTEILTLMSESSNAHPESVLMTITGAAGSIIPSGVISSEDGSFSSVIRFYDTKRAKQPDLFGNGMRMAGVVARMILKNSGSERITVQPEFAGEKSELTHQVVLPEIRLEPSEIKAVDLAPLLEASRNRDDLDVVSVRVRNSGQPGSLIGSIYVTNHTAGVSYDVPLRDSGSPRSMTGSYPWRIDKDYATIVYITNITEQPVGFSGEINYAGGNFFLGARTLAPRETATFDLKSIRGKDKDSRGKSIPKEISLGQFKWAVRGDTQGKQVLVGRAEMVSRSQRVSSSYSCNDPCPPYYGGSIDPFFPPVVLVDNAGSSAAWETAFYDTGYSYGPYAVGASWTIDNSIGTLDPISAHSTSLTGTQEGGAVLDGFIGTQPDYVYDGRDCYYVGTYDEGGQTQAGVDCAEPTNFRQTSVTANNGVLHFRYDWDSSTGTGPGNLANLNKCTIGEKVDYNANDIPFPSPPFPAGLNPDNPTITEGSATGGFLEDDHSTPGTFVKPYQAKTITAAQIYRYRCTCKQNNAWITVLGGLSIVRSVSQNTNGTWKFTIEKSGHTATINPLP